MATVEELKKQYRNDPDFKREVDNILKDEIISPKVFLDFSRRHNLGLTLKDLPEVVKQAKEAGLIKKSRKK